MKRKVRSYLDRFAASTGLLTLWERRMRQGLTILMYHRILPLEQCAFYPLESLIIPVDAFREQVKWLSEHCYVLPLREAFAAMSEENKFEKPLVAVTFDDGYADNYELAAPLLEAHGVRGTFFVTTGFVDNGTPMWFDRAADSWRRLSAENQQILMKQWGEDSKFHRANVQDWMNSLKHAEPEIRMVLINRAESLTENTIESGLYSPMNSAQVQALHNRGHEIASHTVTHPILTQLNDDVLKNELKLSAERLREWTGSNIAGFCYPNGDFNDRVENAVLAAGYSYACTVNTGLNLPGDPLTRLSRLSITCQRTVNAVYGHDSLGFRSELCRFREVLRKF